MCFPNSCVYVFMPEDAWLAASFLSLFSYSRFDLKTKCIAIRHDTSIITLCLKKLEIKTKSNMFVYGAECSVVQNAYGQSHSPRFISLVSLLVSIPFSLMDTCSLIFYDKSQPWISRYRRRGRLRKSSSAAPRVPPPASTKPSGRSRMLRSRAW